MNRKKRRKQPRLRKRKVGIKPSYLIIIATEGEETEPQYFRFLERWCRTKINIEVLPSVRGECDPVQVLDVLDKRVRRLKQEIQLGNEDQFWLVFDYDRWGQEKLDQVRRAANQKSYDLAVSNPCFELWLVLHNQAIEGNAEYTKEQLERMHRDCCGSYNHVNLREEHYCGKIDQAIANAQHIEVDNEEVWPIRTGTRVYLLIDEIKRLSRDPDFPFRSAVTNGLDETP